MLVTIVFTSRKLSLLQRNFELKKSAYDKEVETARAQAELAFQLQTAKVIRMELLEVVIVQRTNFMGIIKAI